MEEFEEDDIKEDVTVVVDNPNRDHPFLPTQDSLTLSQMIVLYEVPAAALEPEVVVSVASPDLVLGSEPVDDLNFFSHPLPNCTR